MVTMLRVISAVAGFGIFTLFGATGVFIALGTLVIIEILQRILTGTWSY
jgi:hypothetical protein